MSDRYDSCLLSCKPCEGCGQHIPKNRTYCEKCTPDATAGDGLRVFADSQMECDVAEVLHAHDSIVWGEALDLAARVLALPALRDVLAASARDAERVARVRAELADAARLLNELAADTDAEPCRYDHHGECQEHSGGERCYDRDAHEFLKSIGVRA